MKKNIKLKLLSMFILSLLVAISVSLLLHFTFFRQFYLNHTENRILEIFDTIELNINDDDFKTIIFNIDREEQVNIAVTDQTLEVVTLSHTQLENGRDTLEDEFKELILSEKNTLESEYVCKILDGEGIADRLVLIKKLSNDNYCIISHPLEPLESSIQAMSTFHVLAGVFASIVGILLTLFFAKQFTKPIIEISDATLAMSKLDFNQKIEYSSQDELGQLANSINILSEKLEENRKALKNELEFQKIMSKNISHELKTPISVIRGYLEALTFGVVDCEETKTEYIEIVLNECHRMNDLINEMLKLSKLTSFQDGGIEKTNFSASEFERRIDEQYSALISNKKIQFQKQIDSVNIFGNFELLVQCFGNFITNAIKYGDGNIIKISIYEQGENYILSLFNTGTPIPESEIPQIFNMFYMVDKARSRELESHGLGLSVSKTVAQLHQGDVCCESLTDGVIFKIILPKK